MEPDATIRDSAGTTAARLGRQAEVVLAAFEISTSQYRVLGQLAEGNEGSSALAEKLAVRPPTLTSVVEGLVQRGFVVRRHGAVDRRTVSYELTAAGAERLNAADEAVQEKLREIAANLDDADLIAQAFTGLELWQHALNAQRRRRIEAWTSGSHSIAK